jgi:uncharacterized membrane protein
MSTPPELTNIHAVMDLERETREKRSRLDRLTDVVSNLASSPTFIVVHLLWFGFWIGFNAFGGATFDRYPFNLLTLVVSLEAIVLTGFVLMAQSRMTQQADRRAHLDLQVNLLAEQELTAILKVQCALAERAGVDLTGIDPRLDQLRRRTDVQRLAAALDTELASVATSHSDAAASAGAPGEHDAARSARGVDVR